MMRALDRSRNLLRDDLRASARGISEAVKDSGRPFIPEEAK
jgi:hypothetical protein